MSPRPRPPHDVVVIGAGHNALVAACYLARAGLDVEVLEARGQPGGAVGTVRPWPGYRVDVGSTAHILIRHTGVIEELDLASVGLRYAEMDPWGYAPGPGGGLLFWRDLDLTCAGLAAACGDREAAAYAAFVAQWRPRMRWLMGVFGRPPTAGRLLAAAAALAVRDRCGTGELLRQFLQPADQLLEAHFRDERLRAALAWFGAQGDTVGSEPGSAPAVAWVVLLHDRAPGYPVGGSGMLARALVDRFAGYGGRLRLAEPAARIETRSGRVSAVLTAAGDRLAARAVLAGCHVEQTLRLLGGKPAREAAGRLRVGGGLALVLRLGVRELPRYPDAPAGAHHGLQLLVDDRAVLHRAHGEFRAGRLPAQPATLVLAPSAVDPSLAPPGRHVVTVWGQWYPHRPREGDWHRLAGPAADRLLARVAAAAPGFAAAVEHRRVVTPPDLAAGLGLPRGNVMHLESGLDTLFGLRPLPRWSGYRTPVPGLYLTGASTHPGGGVFGAAGRSAARLLLADLSPPRRAQPRSLSRIRR